MKNNIYLYLFLAFHGVLCASISGSPDTLNGISSHFLNLLNRKVLYVQFSDTLYLGDSREENTSDFTYVLYYNGDEFHISEAVKVEGGDEVIRNVFYDGKYTYETFSDLKSVTIRKGDGGDVRLMDFSVVRAIRYMALPKDLVVGATDIEIVSNASENSYITWRNGDYECILSVYRLGLPSKLECRGVGGGVIRSIYASTEQGKFSINVNSFDDDGALSFSRKVNVTIIDDPSFDRSFVPKRSGIFHVTDYRSGQVRRYLALDIIPDESFVNRIFKNPDDFKRYMAEMQRFDVSRETDGNNDE